VAICTGYRPFGGIKPDRETVRKYDRIARDLLTSADHSTTMPLYEAMRDQLHALALAFVREVSGR
jgi:hypothetical protein